MTDNIFNTNIEKKPKNSYSKGFKVLLWLAITITSSLSTWGIGFVFGGIQENVWVEIGVNEYARQVILYLCIICCFISLIKIAIDKTAFSRVISLGIRIIGGIVIFSAFLLPRLPDYPNRGFVIMKLGTFVWFDGNTFAIGILILVFSGIIKEGFSMKTELDELL